MKEITAQEVFQKLQDGKTLNMIDVRETDEIVQGIIPGAQHIALGDLPKRINEFDKDKHYVMICRSGGRSGNACKFLSEQGYDVANMVGGMLDWKGETVKSL